MALVSLFAGTASAFTITRGCALAPSSRFSRLRSGALVAQLVRRDDDDNASFAASIDDKVREVTAAVGGESASVQFMMTQAMRSRLSELGYSQEDIDRMEPQRAAMIIQQGTPSSKVPQRKAKTKRERFEIQFTCNVCDGLNSHSISYHAYTKGTVIVQCPGCNSTHLIADNLDYFNDLNFTNIEQVMAGRGRPVTRVVTDGVAASAAAAAIEAEMPEEAPAAADSPVGRRTGGQLEGITDDQAARIRDAIRASKQRRKQQQQQQPSEGTSNEEQ